MSKQKERKLKKLRKQTVWPYVFGIFMVIIVFAILAFVISAFMVISSAYDKLQVGFENSSKVAEVVGAEWNEENEDGIADVCEQIVAIMPNVKDICIIDENGTAVYQYGESVLNRDMEVSFLGEEKVKLYLSDDAESILYVDDDNVVFRWDSIMDDAISEGKNTDDISIWQGVELAKLNFWYEFPMGDDDYSIGVRSSISVKSTEFLFAGIVLVIILVFALILILYYLISIFRLVFERRKLGIILSTDVVTGGYNMQYFTKQGNKLLKKWKRNRHNYAVVTIRMDKYRNFCSCYGVKEGEELLEGLHMMLQKVVSQKEIIAHAEKADFALLLKYRTEEELNRRLREILWQMEAVKAEQKKYFSVGVYNVSHTKIGIDSMYNCAGVARSVVTEDSENRIAWFSTQMQNDQIWTHKVENDMERALRNKEFQVYLQPKYSTKDEVLSGAEALVRWIHPTEGFVAPYKFIPIFENNGFIIHLDDYMITEVARQQAKWIAEGKKVVPISVNVSRVHFAREDLAEHICRLVDQFGVPHNVIELELTESAFFDDKGVLLNTIKKLKSYGFEISMDDFGAGYSSLNSLRELPLDVLKLDAGFFKDTDEEGRGQLIVGDAISLAKKLDMRIVAEGIETREQVDFLAEKDCDLIQGYYFAKPMPIAEFEEQAFGAK